MMIRDVGRGAREEKTNIESPKMYVPHGAPDLESKFARFSPACRRANELRLSPNA